MLFATHWTIPRENINGVIARFKETGGAPPDGVRLIGRWHDTSQRRGVIISEAESAIGIAAWARAWSDLMTFETYPVLDDTDAAKVLFG
jgi:hypothetical protein